MGPSKLAPSKRRLHIQLTIHTMNKELRLCGIMPNCSPIKLIWGNVSTVKNDLGNIFPSVYCELYFTHLCPQWTCICNNTQWAVPYKKWLDSILHFLWIQKSLFLVNVTSKNMLSDSGVTWFTQGITMQKSTAFFLGIKL